MSGIETPTAAELEQFGRTRKGKRTSNAEWVSPTDPDGRSTRLKERRPRLACNPEYVLDIDSGVVAASIYPADQGNTTKPGGTWKAAATGLDAADAALPTTTPSELVVDIGFHNLAVLRDLAAGPWTTRRDESRPKEVQRGHGGTATGRALCNNRSGLGWRVGQAALQLRAERIERSIENTLDCSGSRRTHLRGRGNVHKPHLVHINGLCLVMRLLLCPSNNTARAANGRLLLWFFEPAAELGLALVPPPTAVQAALPKRPIIPVRRRSPEADP